MTDERLLENFLEEGSIGEKEICQVIAERKVFPCYFGSALKLQGIEEFLRGIETYTSIPEYGKEFGAKVYKISRDAQGNRLTHLKITGGKLKVKDIISGGNLEEKINQIRIYSGEKFTTVNEAKRGTICAVTGLSETKPGEGLGCEHTGFEPVLEPVLTYQMILPEEVTAATMLPKLRQLEEEEPELHIVWKEDLQEIQVQMMGEVQTQI